MSARDPYRQAGGSLDILLYGVAPTLGDQVDHLLRARLTPDVAGYSREMPVCPAFGRLLERVFRSEQSAALPTAKPNQYRQALDTLGPRGDDLNDYQRECARATQVLKRF